MSVSSGEQRRGALDKYVHKHTSTVNNATVWYDEDAKDFVSNETTPAAHETGAPTAAAAPEDAEEGGSAEETAAASAQWIPNYRGDGNPEVNSPTVSVPLRIHAKAWQEPWKRVKRPVRATEAELAANDAVLAQE